MSTTEAEISLGGLFVSSSIPPAKQAKTYRVVIILILDFGALISRSLDMGPFV